MYDELLAEGLIGTDEAGKGDYFGPLVCAACYVNGDNLTALKNIKVRDSKKISDNRVCEMAAVVKKLCPHNIIVIGPEKYNRLYADMKNLNKILAWAHAKAIENLLEKVECREETYQNDGFPPRMFATIMCRCNPPLTVL